MMKYEDVLEMLAPCGLNCKKCMAYSKGEIKELSTALIEKLGAFERYAERFSAFLPVFKNYLQFKQLLEFFTQGDCDGCRKGDCKYPDCGVAKCYQARGIDFCFLCDEFPCEKTNFDPDLLSRWLEMNTRMREIGVEAYYEEIKDQPRYK